MKPKKMSMKEAEREYEHSGKDKREDRKGAKEIIRKEARKEFKRKK